jgi:hypothetical protein
MGDHEPEHPVAQELEPLVGVLTPLHPRGVGEGEQAERFGEPVDQRPEGLGRAGIISCG